MPQSSSHNDFFSALDGRGDQLNMIGFFHFLLVSFRLCERQALSSEYAGQGHLEIGDTLHSCASNPGATNNHVTIGILLNVVFPRKRPTDRSLPRSFPACESFQCAKQKNFSTL
jgi:hypothetical protein